MRRGESGGDEANMGAVGRESEWRWRKSVRECGGESRNREELEIVGVERRTEAEEERRSGEAEQGGGRRERRSGEAETMRRKKARRGGTESEEREAEVRWRWRRGGGERLEEK
ncbi:hypothetical protein HNY73_000493 [Argiope bruennichi]|uniref:Uncharacterized protein n=1 Tax=Argiope bruennichi TaxID=94029 RepID=A0A8T0FY86_ARGBR|nr:hypothetical protein HNY73_000493 [Argiope bruennichi]